MVRQRASRDGFESGVIHLFVMNYGDSSAEMEAWFKAW